MTEELSGTGNMKSSKSSASHD